jgi:nucleotide-binding universal stress UspA family protein
LHADDSKILAPVAFTAACRSAAAYASRVAERFGSDLHILHAVEPMADLAGIESASFYEVRENRLRSAERELSLMLAATDSAAQVHTHAVEGDRSRVIVRFARNEQIDLIVMLTHGYGPFRRLLLGSVTAKVLHDSERPIWTGTHIETGQASDSGGIATTVCAADLGPQSPSILLWSVELANAYSVVIHLVHVTPPGLQSSWHEKAILDANTQVKRMLAQTNGTAEIHILSGEVPATVAQLAQSTQADLVVIGRGCGDSGGRLPSNAYAILRDVPCPVLSV